MKKLVSLTLALIMCMSLLTVMAGCDDKKEDSKGNTSSSEAEKKDINYEKMTEEQLLDTFVKDRKNPTLDEFTDLLSTYSNVKITDDLEFEENITTKALNLLRESDPKYPSSSDIFKKLIKSESPQVRGYAMGYTGSLFGVDEEDRNLIMDTLKNEKEPYVLKCAVSALSNEGKSDPEIGKFLVDMSKNDHPKVRLQAAYALGNTWSIGVDGAYDAMITMMSDEDKEVKAAAYKYIGKLNDEKCIDPIVEMLNNQDEAEFHDEGLNSLMTLWYDYPFHEKTSEKAYKATMDYYKTVEHNETTPPWLALSDLDNKNEDKFDAWKKKATYYNPEEIVKIMKDILADEKCDWLARTGAIKVVKVHGTKEDFDSLKKIVDGLKDDKASLIKNSYEQTAKEK